MISDCRRRSFPKWELFSADGTSGFDIHGFLAIAANRSEMYCEEGFRVFTCQIFKLEYLVAFGRSF